MLILIADDYDDSAETLAMLVTDALGHETLTAKDGREAADLAYAHHPEVAVLDIDMPVLDGIEAAQEIRQRMGGQRPLLIAHSGGINANRAAHSGLFDHVLTKPTDFQRLFELLRKP